MCKSVIAVGIDNDNETSDTHLFNIISSDGANIHVETIAHDFSFVLSAVPMLALLIGSA
jgi:hypothetical protein